MSLPTDTVPSKDETVITSAPTPTPTPDSECNCACGGYELICKTNCCSDCVADYKSDCDNESKDCNSRCAELFM